MPTAKNQKWHTKNCTMSKRRKVHTLRDLHLLEGSPSLESGKGDHPPMKIAHIPALPQADAALAMLRRLHHEFYPILERRGYPVLSLSEVCCCGDGLDHSSKHKKRKRRIVSKNILGYNQTMFGRGTRRKSHTIHLRLRPAHNHNVLFSYEEVAGTMCHELAHCQHGPHNAIFYKLMDDIQEQHAVYLARGIVADRQGFPLNSNEAYRLGGTSSHNRAGHRQKAAARAAQRRIERTKWMPQGPQKLGGDPGFREFLCPGHAAGMAAEARSLEDEVWCQPCPPIEVTDDEADEADIPSPPMEKKPTKKKKKRNNDNPIGQTKENQAENQVDGTCVIDLTGDDDAGPPPAAAAPVRNGGGSKRKQGSAALAPTTTTTTTTTRVDTTLPWDCLACTFRNTPPALACAICGKPAAENSLDVARSLDKKERVAHVKETEVARSQEQFGFNIYGNGSKRSGQMKHIT